jgi:hypothetical protein
MAIVSEAVVKVVVTDDKQNNVQIEFNGGQVPIDAIIVSLEMVLERLKQSPESQDRRNIN